MPPDEVSNVSDQRGGGAQPASDGVELQSQVDRVGHRRWEGP